MTYLAIKLNPSYAQFGEGCVVVGNYVVVHGVLAFQLTWEQCQRHIELIEIYDRVGFNSLCSLLMFANRSWCWRALFVSMEVAFRCLVATVVRWSTATRTATNVDD